MTDALLITNISRLVTMEAAPHRAGPLGVIENAAVRVRDGRIVWLGPVLKLPKVESHEEVIDARSAVAMPGLIDCHTHLVHAGSRQGEFNLRSQGRTYNEIAAAGGGIMSTVRATRDASFEDLLATAKSRADEALSHGSTTLEIKTGYGLDPQAESKIVDVIAALKDGSSPRILGTFLGAHIVPQEYKEKRSEYLKLVIEKMLPAAAASGAISACDVFVEEGAFTADEAREIAAAAKKHGFALHLHVDQFSNVSGGELAAELGALSADHLDRVSDGGIKAMAKAGVVGVVLPGASFFAGLGPYPDARKMIDLGLRVAISTDYNPGTNPSLDLMLSATIAVTQMGMTCDEALLGITRNAAAALGLADRGILTPGNLADLILLDAPDEYYLLYRYGGSFVKKVIAGGK